MSHDQEAREVRRSLEAIILCEAATRAYKAAAQLDPDTAHAEICRIIRSTVDTACRMHEADNYQINQDAERRSNAAREALLGTIIAVLSILLGYVLAFRTALA